MDHIDIIITKWGDGGIEAHYLLVLPSIGQLCLNDFIEHQIYVDFSSVMLSVCDWSPPNLFSLHESLSYLC